ncbi:hypothetical protein SEA_KEANU_112 [Streptomyces phage Keanu]|nr:hypothetical protein SEA_KEANU_112 [Streptomyces phage Keanu]
MDAMYEIKFDRFNQQLVAMMGDQELARVDDCSPQGHAALALAAATKLDEWFN